ncbi:MAG: putative peroxidase-related enzyme [Planctomycetota bacterium]
MAFVDGIRTGWQVLTDLSAPDRALCEFAEALTKAPAGMRESHIQALRAEGFGDVAVHDAIQVIAYFNYINRIADAVDVELEPEYPPHPREKEQAR